MASYTPNYHLKKPSANDPVDIDDLNDNFDILDEHLKEAEQSSSLPEVTSADNDKIAIVVDGEWALITISDVLARFFVYDGATNTLDILLDGSSVLNNDVEGM